jgi:hypothetical protein
MTLVRVVVAVRRGRCGRRAGVHVQLERHHAADSRREQPRLRVLPVERVVRGSRRRRRLRRRRRVDQAPGSRL